MKDLTKTLAKKALAEKANQHFNWVTDKNLVLTDKDRNYHKKEAIDYATAYFDIRGHKGLVSGFGAGIDTSLANEMDSILQLLTGCEQ